MFQFAAARALALERGKSVKLDTSSFGKYKLHQGFQLQSAFMGRFDIASGSEVSEVLGWQRAPLAQRILSHSHAAMLRKKSLIVEPHFHYWSGIRDAPEDCYLRGYWQSERYFQPHAEAIRADFSFKFQPTGAASLFAQEIGRVNAVSLHVRRGDYVNNPAAAAMHGVCSIDYYDAAIAYIVSRVDNPVFFIFSDDMPWVKQNLTVAAPTHHVGPSNQAYEDMHLMSLCKHHVIANSSFSWWGAWLNAYPEKIVIAPKQWFTQSRKTEHLLPQSWVRL